MAQFRIYKRPKMILKKNFFTIIICIIALLAASCGKKGEPTLKAFEKPATVENIKALHRDNNIYISWQYPASKRSKIRGCQILRSDGADSNYRELAFLKTDEALYVDKDFTAGIEYYYKLRCLSLKDVYSDYSDVIKVAPLTLLSIPKEISFITTNDSIKIQWQHISDAHYNIYKSYQKGIYTFSPLNSSLLKENFYIDKIYTEAIVYYTVRSHRGTEIRDESPPSEELGVNPADFVPSAPSGLIYVPLEKKIYLLWNENPELWIKGYKVYRKTASEREFILIGDTLTPVFAESMPPDAKTNYYVTAVGPKKESRPSEMLLIDIRQEN